MSNVVTQGIRIKARSQFVPERSSPADSHYFFAYTVNIANEGSEPAKLVSRHWIITDDKGRIHEVEGPGVVGEQPLLEPGESFEYTSACPLGTAYGTMHGTYRMVRGDGTQFDAEIAPFELEAPSAQHDKTSN